MRYFEKLTKYVLFACLFVSVPQLAVADQGMDAFNQAIIDFKEKNFEGAIRGFQMAAEQGVDVSALHQNLGSSYYKAGQYANAEAEFRLLAQDEAMAPLAYYNLGRVSVAKGNNEQAKIWFNKVLQSTQDQKLHLLANRQLDLLNNTANRSNVTASKWYSLAFAAVGYDDNVTLESDTVITATKSSAAVTRLFAYTRGILMGDVNNGLLFKGSVYSKLNSGQSQINIADYRAGLFYAKKAMQWNNELGAAAHHTTLGSSSFQDKFSFSINSKRQISSTMKLDLRWVYSNINASTQYQQLNGSNQEFRALAKWNLTGKSKFKVFYQLTLNDRDDNRGTDITTGLPFFFSSSPTRHRIKGVYEWVVAPKYTLEVSGEYRLSSYNDDNNEVTPVARTIGREDNRTKAGIGLIRKYRPNMDLSLEYEYVNNDSNIGRFSYSHNTLMGKIQYTF